MKKLSFLMLAVAGLLLAACSSDKDVADVGGQDLLNGKTEGYFKINLNLPTAPVVSTRGWQESASGTLDNGDENEYAVKSCILLLFDGESETQATLKQVVSLSTGFGTKEDDPNQITTNHEEVVHLTSAPTDNLYALVVINGKGNIEMASATEIKLNDGTGSLSSTLVSGCKIGDLQAALAHSNAVNTNDFIQDDEGTKYFFMTNAVLSNEKGGTVAPSTAAGNLHILAPVDKDFIYETEAKADEGKAACDIYVERGMAKVTLKKGDNYLKVAKSGGTDVLTAKTGITINASLDGWCLDITNKYSYIVRQVPTGSIWNLKSNGSASVDEYRFVGANAVDAVYGSNVAGYRTYWAYDPNYSDKGYQEVSGVKTGNSHLIEFDTNNQNTTNFSYATYASDKINGFTNSGGTDKANPLYCLENTFDVEHQDARYTTRAILGVKLASTGTFYVMGADRKTLYTETDVKNQVKTELMNTTAFSDWYDAQGNGELTGSDITITWDKDADAAGKLKVSKINIHADKIKSSSDKYDATNGFTIDASTATFTDKTVNYDFTDLIKTLNDMIYNVERFKDGLVYYPIRIKHFGDDLTPWNKGEASPVPKEVGAKGDSESWADYLKRMIDGIYPATNRDANYLGRYGVVRNNWYELEIGEIERIGYSEPPVIPSHPDDELEDLYIKARINILSWAKRPQKWNLK